MKKRQRTVVALVVFLFLVVFVGALMYGSYSMTAKDVVMGTACRISLYLICGSQEQ